MINPEFDKAELDILAGWLATPHSLVTSFDGKEEYFHDATDEQGVPIALVMAESEEDVVATVNFCRSHGIAIVPRGAGTGLSGGCVPTPNSLLLSTERMDSLTIYPLQKTALCGPGLITKALQDSAAEIGLAYPPDPASYEESTLGGNVAEGAGGLRCKRFGVTKDYVIGLRAVTADGSIITTGWCGSGDSLSGDSLSIGDLFIASEGTLVVITEIALRLIDLPEPGRTILAAFDKSEEAAQTVSDITTSGIIPTVLEYLDGDAAACSNEYHSNEYQKTEGLDAKVAAILLIEAPTEEIESIGRFCRKNNCSYFRMEEDPAKAEALWAVRRDLSKAVKAIAPVRISEDVAVPNSKFPALVSFVAEMNRSSPLRINSFGHAGDGNLHVNFLSMTGSDQDVRLIEAAIERLMKKAIELGGTLSGEHGIGLAKRRYLPLEFDSATLDYMRQIKSVFDPEGLFNPGKIFEG